MGLTISDKGGEYEKLDAGRYKAICYKIVDAGTRPESFKGVGCVWFGSKPF